MVARGAEPARHSRREPDLRRAGGRGLSEPGQTDLTSAAIPALGESDHVTGSGDEVVIAYMDLACPMCASRWPRLRADAGRLCFRHFPIGTRRPRASALHAAAEAASLQRPESFFEMVDSIYADQGRQDDPHLWGRARAIGLDLERFESDRRSAAVAARVRADFIGGVRAGITGTPALFELGGARPKPLPR